MRGFVLGEDDRIDAATVDDFKRSGLAHLLAVSGQNVILLALLAVPLLALLGVPLRARLLCVLALIAIYVPVTGAGPSIQRAGVMGAAGMVAALAGRPRSRWYAILLAAFVTLAINPRAGGDAGWQLSFAAVVGILLWAGPIRDACSARLRAAAVGERVAGWRRALAEGAGVTIAATLSTAPLMAHHFGTVSLASLPANLLALPAVAPLMWLGMLAALAGQLPWLPVQPLTGLAGLLAAYVAQVAHWLGSPGWARRASRSPGPTGSWLHTPCSALALWLAARLGAPPARAWHGRRLAAGPRPGDLRSAPARSPSPGWALGRTAADPAAGLRMTVLDVGQGDAILLEPADGEPVLVDGGPPGDDLRRKLEDQGISSLAAAIVTHDQSDHAGGIGSCSAVPGPPAALREPSRDLLRPRAPPACGRWRSPRGRIVSGSLRIDVLWPPRALLEGPPPDDPNQIVAGPPGSLAALRHAAHRRRRGRGGADRPRAGRRAQGGPPRLRGRRPRCAARPRVPRLAVISVGADNPYGHPSPATLATLAEHHVASLRTDQKGDVTIEVGRRGWRIEIRGLECEW